MEKGLDDRYNLMDYSFDKEILIRSLSTLLRVKQKEKEGFTFKPVRVLENKKYRYAVTTSEYYEYSITEENTVNFKDYL